jgi:hypothetical protein
MSSRAQGAASVAIRFTLMGSTWCMPPGYRKARSCMSAYAVALGLWPRLVEISRCSALRVTPIGAMLTLRDRQPNKRLKLPGLASAIRRGARVLSARQPVA